MVTTMTWLAATECLCEKMMFVFRLSQSQFYSVLIHSLSPELMPKRKSEDVAQRRASNTMAKINRTKGQTTIYKTTHKSKDLAKGTPLKSGIELSTQEE
jgi:hypothetical protein